MPAVSKAQFKKMFILYKQGKITKKQLDDYTKSINYKKLPAHSKTKGAKAIRSRRKKGKKK